MKNKALTIILSAVLIGCIGLSIYQYQTAVNLKNELSALTNTKNELTTEIENKTAELNNITSEIEEANNVISELTINVESLTESTEALQAEIDDLESENSVNNVLGENEVSTKTDTETGDLGLTQEEEDEVDAAIDKALREAYPELFGGGTTYTQGNYEHVGTPDSGEYINPDFALDGDYSEGAGAIVY